MVSRRRTTMVLPPRGFSGQKSNSEINFCNFCANTFSQMRELKLLALAISFAIWATYTPSHTRKLAFPVPLEFTTMPPQLEITGDIPNAVRVAAGRSALLRRMIAADLSLRLDMKDGQAGTRPANHARNGDRTFWRHCSAGYACGNPRYSCATPFPSGPYRMTLRVLNS